MRQDKVANLHTKEYILNIMKRNFWSKLFSFSYFLNNSCKLFFRCHPAAGPRPTLTLTPSIRPSIFSLYFSNPKLKKAETSILNPSHTKHQKKCRNIFDKYKLTQIMALNTYIISQNMLRKYKGRKASRKKNWQLTALDLIKLFSFYVDYFFYDSYYNGDVRFSLSVVSSLI